VKTDEALSKLAESAVNQHPKVGKTANASDDIHWSW
jgi:hypothetical protein